MSDNDKKYKQKIINKISIKVFKNKIQVYNFIGKNAKGSLLSIRIFALVTETKYFNKYHIYHEIISRFYQKIPENNYYIANEIIKDFISQNPKLKNKDLLKCLKVFEEGNVSPKARNRKIIRKYTSETESFYQDFNNWLRSPDENTIENIGYFISNFMNSLNEYGRLEDKYVEGENELYRGLRLSFCDLLLYKMCINNVIMYLPPTSTTINKKTAEFFSSDGIKENQYATVMKIKYNCKENEIPNVVDITHLSKFDEDERLFLPFSFFKIKNVIINEKNKKAIIEMDALSREKINEKEISADTVINYNEEKNIMECIKKNFAICCAEEEKIKQNIFDFKFASSKLITIKFKIEEKIKNECEDCSCKNKGKNLVDIIEKKTIKNASHKKCDCTSIISLDELKKWKISKVKIINGINSRNSSLISISPLKNWKIFNVKNFSYVFKNFQQIRELNSLSNLSNWKIETTKNSLMLEGCIGITSKNLEKVMKIFKNSEEIDTINELSNWNDNDIYNITNMSCNCKKIKPVSEIKNMKCKKIIKYNGMNENFLLPKSIEEVKDSNKNLYEEFNVTRKNRGNHFIKSMDRDIKDIKNYNTINYDKKTVIKNSYYTENLNYECKLKIFGKKFFPKSKSKSSPKIRNKKTPLCSKNKKILCRKNTIELILKSPLTKFKHMFKHSKTLTIMNDLENRKLKNLGSIFFGNHHLFSFNTLQNLGKKSINTNNMSKNISSITEFSPSKNRKMAEMIDANKIVKNFFFITSSSDLNDRNINFLTNFRNFKNCINFNLKKNSKNGKISIAQSIKKILHNYNKIKAGGFLTDRDISEIKKMNGILVNCDLIFLIKMLENWKIDVIRIIEICLKLLLM